MLKSENRLGIQPIVPLFYSNEAWFEDIYIYNSLMVRENIKMFKEIQFSGVQCKDDRQGFLLRSSIISFR